MSKEYLLEDALKKWSNRTLYIGAWSGWFYIGNSDCKKELRKVSEASHKTLLRAVELAERRYQIALQNYKDAIKKDTAEDLLRIAEESLQTAKDNLEWYEEHPDFLKRKVLSDTERIPDPDEGRLIKIEGSEQARYWLKSEYERGKHDKSVLINS